MAEAVPSAELVNADATRPDAEDTAVANEAVHVEQFLTFVIGSEDYAVPLASVQEIIGVQRVTHVPGVAPHLCGVINLRGTVVPVIDVRVRFGMDTRDTDERTCIVVVQVCETSVGLLVDTVSEVVDVKPSVIESAPRASTHEGGEPMIRGLVRIADRVKILIDIDRLLFDEVVPGGECGDEVRTETN
jgi:purine-binding chemotaxis protein CheW